ncbi:hypothetical protein [Streptomyces sp. NPDC047028]|uniref:hypothetical protein n=1 Tax=Streptomyces sp. NPDC047028 TaxID=3155793 RepID=UPI0033D659FB
MRGLPARRLASSALSAALLVGITGPAALAADSARERDHAVSRAPAHGADALLAQVRAHLAAQLGQAKVRAAVLRAKAAATARARGTAVTKAGPLDDLDTFLDQLGTKVDNLVAQALKNGDLSDAQTQAFVDDLNAAIGKITASIPDATDSTDATDTAGATGNTTSTASGTATLTVPGKNGDSRTARTPRDTGSDLLGSLQDALNNLLGALTSGDLGGLPSAVTGLIGGVVGLLTSALGSLTGGLLGGLTSSLPSTLPATAPTTLPSLPALPTG